MKQVWIALVTLILLPAAVLAGDKVLTMSTTTSTQASGLLDVLLPELAKDTGIEVKVMAKGTGAAIRDGKDGNVDVIFVHARAREDAFVKEGYGTRRYGVMHNDFVILGPEGDPAGIRGMQDAALAMKKIAEKGALFISRGDDSGTHTKEQQLWEKTGMGLEMRALDIMKKGKLRTVTFRRPKGDWYLSVGQGMGKAMNMADERQAYLLSDRGTFIKYKYGRTPAVDLVVLSEGDASLRNPYGVIPVNPEKFPHVRYDLAETFAKWLVSPKAQTLIRDYRLVGKPLFHPDAI